MLGNASDWTVLSREFSLISSSYAMKAEIHFLSSPSWVDYELLDSGNGQKLERFGLYTFIRPEVQALWKPAAPPERWQDAHAVFQPSAEESGGHWVVQRKIPEQWEMSYRDLRFSVMTTHGRHMGVFPECAAQWDWMGKLIREAKTNPGRELQVLNLFGYTGLASLVCAANGARVTHVDASKKSVAWARKNQEISGLLEKPIRWIVDDAQKFVEREVRRGVKYDGLVLDPPKFGRGPKGEVWEVYKSLPTLLSACRKILSDTPLFVGLTIYAVKLPALHAQVALQEMMDGCEGKLECGELVTEEKSAGRLLSQAVYTRWES
jgi:23S rRNA (cytosine1962-C5)-methyltransferase